MRRVWHGVRRSCVVRSTRSSLPVGSRFSASHCSRIGPKPVACSCDVTEHAPVTHRKRECTAAWAFSDGRAATRCVAHFAEDARVLRKLAHARKDLRRRLSVRPFGTLRENQVVNALGRQGGRGGGGGAGERDYGVSHARLGVVVRTGRWVSMGSQREKSGGAAHQSCTEYCVDVAPKRCVENSDVVLAAVMADGRLQ